MQLLAASFFAVDVFLVDVKHFCNVLVILATEYELQFMYQYPLRVFPSFYHQCQMQLP